MQFQSKCANDAYREIVQHVGKVVAEHEADALRETDLDRRARMRAEAKDMSVDGLCKAIQVAHNIECSAIGLVTAFKGSH